jgi:uncharacterized protein YabE (DUF348 family)
MKILPSDKSFLDWHKHPFAVPVITFMVLFFLSCTAFLLLSGQTIGANDAKVVHLYVDGEKRVMPTRSQTVGEVLAQANIELIKEDIVEPAADSQIIGSDFSVNVYRAKPVTIEDEKGGKITTKVAESSPSEMAKKAGVDVFPEDRVQIAYPDDALEDGVIGAKIVVDRATPAIINLYGNDIPVRTHSKTVGELLNEKGIKTLEGDTIQPAPGTTLQDNTQIFIVRDGKKVVSVEEVVQPSVERIGDPNVPAGVTVVREAGSPGKKVVTYEIDLKNDQEVGRRKIQEFVAVQPVRRVIAEGTKVVISNPSANVTIGQRLAAERGWTGSQFQCLYQLWQKESKWNHLASNRSSGAYGIPQALPGSKMGTIASDWQTNPDTQIKWGLGYIARSYGNPCAAWAKSRASGWY